MRLAQLARKLALRPSEIVDFLAKNQIQIEEGSNTRLEDSQVVLIMGKFAPESTVEDIEAVSLEKDEPLPVKEEIQEEEATAVSADENDIEMATVRIEPSEVIKAPKIELSGLKVLGKIDLPEPKKKESAMPAAENAADAPVSPRTPDTRRANVNKRESRKTQNPVSLAREREAIVAKEKREAEEKHLREQKTKNYYKKVKVAPPTKRMKLVDEASEELSPRDMLDPPKTLVGKFFRWLKT
jgi:hypothetical protein